ncbi:MAG: hypothetical protein H6553_11490 [Chitinophagales bacterium]|nr:hypothetical protein [Chitinophagales bacterium]
MSGNTYKVIEGTTCIVVDRSSRLQYRHHRYYNIISNLPSKDTIRYKYHHLCNNGMSIKNNISVQER